MFWRKHTPVLIRIRVKGCSRGLNLGCRRVGVRFSSFYRNDMFAYFGSRCRAFVHEFSAALCLRIARRCGLFIAIVAALVSGYNGLAGL